MKDRLVFIGGFASNRHQATSVAESIGSFYGTDSEGLSLRDAEADPSRLDKMVRDATVITHSAGALPIKGLSPSEIVAVAPQLPLSRSTLVGRAVVKVVRLSAGSLQTKDRFRRVNDFNLYASGELLTHPITSVRQLGRISGTNSLDILADAQGAGIQTTVGFMQNDAFFTPTNQQVIDARAGKITVVTDIPGEHDEILLYPENVLRNLPLD